MAENTLETDRFGVLKKGAGLRAGSVLFFFEME